jgi:predicted DNA binding CopG/RHH family protein
MKEDKEKIPAPMSLDAAMQEPDFKDGFAFLVETKAADITKRVNITVAESELARIDKRAKARGMNRSSFLIKSALSDQLELEDA